MQNKAILTLILSFLPPLVSAATKIDLSHQSTQYITPYFALKSQTTSTSTHLKTMRTDIDFNKTAHVHIQQMYNNFPILGATSVIHIPNSPSKNFFLGHLKSNTKMNGVIYEGIAEDLAASHTSALSDAQKNKALQTAKIAFEKKIGAVNLQYKKESLKTVVYVDKNKKAHYAFLISFYYDDNKGAHYPHSIIDAESLQTYKAWDAVLNAVDPVMNGIYPEFVDAVAGGIGGNDKIGEIIYDGKEGHPSSINIKKFDYSDTYNGGTLQFFTTYCVLQNNNIMIYDMSYGNISGVPCSENPKHDSIFWLSNDHERTRWKNDEMNGGYSPSLDAFYAATTVENFYKDWYGIPALVNEDGVKPMKLIMRVHYGREFDNAFWDGEQMTFGDGGSYFYPLTSLDITAHEISHGFTQQHSNIAVYEPQMLALHEAFSDEAAVAVQYYADGKIIWDLGRGILKNEGAMRYLDNPKKDGRSIDHMKDFDDTEPHGGAGIFNKAFYLIATSKNWDVRKAFNVMLKANMHYWTSSMTTLTEAACGVMSATKDYGYDQTDVRIAFFKVGIDTNDCEAF